MRRGISGGLTYETLNANLKQAQYAVRGELVIRALAHQQAIKRGESRPFDKLVFCNIGNPHELGQKPITFFRQVFSLVNNLDLLNHPRVGELFPADAIARARKYVDAVPGGTGAYTNSQGVDVVREEVAEFISKRDGVPAHASDIFLTDGASPAVQMMIRSMIRDSSDAVMIPIPQYPLYSGSLALYGGTQVGYQLVEERGWGLDPVQLKSSIEEAKKQGLNVRAIAVINPGNPTGNCLSVDNIREVLTFAKDNGLVVLADEVYQDNVWAAGKEWRSFKQVACEMGLVDPAATNVNKGVQIASFHSTSKGFTGECGRRGGYMELVGFDDKVRAELYKLASISLCSNSGGQIMMGLMTNPPKPGEESHASYIAERDAILQSLKRRAIKLVDALRAMEGVSCEAPEGALYVFPTIRLPQKAMDAAKAAGKAPDTFYALSLLDETGVVMVPGSGFGQKAGTFHLRSTILPPEDQMDRVISAVQAHHKGFMDRYRG